MKKHSGFTLLELLIVMMIVGILVGVGLPNLREGVLRNKLIATSNELVAALHIARSEAIKLGRKVTVCENDGSGGCGNTGEWDNGWLVFVDSDHNLAYTDAYCDNPSIDCLLRRQDDVDNSDRIIIRPLDSNSAPVSSFTFTPRGMPLSVTGAAQAGNFSVCALDDNGSTFVSRAVVVSFAGRSRVSDNAAVITCP